MQIVGSLDVGNSPRLQPLFAVCLGRKAPSLFAFRNICSVYKLFHTFPAPTASIPSSSPSSFRCFRPPITSSTFILFPFFLFKHSITVSPSDWPALKPCFSTNTLDGVEASRDVTIVKTQLLYKPTPACGASPRYTLYRRPLFRPQRTRAHLQTCQSIFLSGR